jgi:hypothetical protein
MMLIEGSKVFMAMKIQVVTPCSDVHVRHRNGRLLEFFPGNIRSRLEECLRKVEVTSKTPCSKSNELCCIL